MATSQHRCVFVGNIPYDATEEQLVQICEEVGPVVSFRLVIDRETGKPKGYGFCEYKDEETALSARRNLQGYEINGRQLRVDFAENDKGADRNREQGRGGPGLVANVDPQKQVGRMPVLGDSGLYQPVGLSLAMTAATVMGGALGGAQASGSSNQNGLQGQPAMGADALTLHLAKMSRNQLNEILSELKAMATQNKEQARQLLLANPQLTKALFQAEIIQGMVSPQMLQLPNIRAAPGQLPQTPLHIGQQGQTQQPAVQTLHGLPPLAQSKVPLGLTTRVPGQASAVPPNSLAHNQYSAIPQLPQNQVLQNFNTGVSTFPSIHPQTSNSVSVGPQIQVGATNLGQNNQPVAPNGTLQPSLLTRPPLSHQAFQPSSSILSSIPNMKNKEANRPAQVTNGSSWPQRADIQSNLPSVSSEKANMVHGTTYPMNRPSKMVKLNDGRSNIFPAADLNPSTSVSRPSQVSGPGLLSGNQIPKAAEVQNSEKQVPQLLPEVESALLQQVLNLTPEQLSSLPPDQQQQVIQLQQMLR